MQASETISWTKHVFILRGRPNLVPPTTKATNAATYDVVVLLFVRALFQILEEQRNRATNLR